MTIPTATDGAASYSTANLTAGDQLATTTVLDGTASGADLVTDKSGKGYFYMAVISDDGKYMAISTTTKTATMGTGTGNSTLRWSASAFTVYSASAVPEPTSGILMLVGLGALALRRRKA